jgi:hypothetical protein
MPRIDPSRHAEAAGDREKRTGGGLVLTDPKGGILNKALTLCIKANMDGTWNAWRPTPHRQPDEAARSSHAELGGKTRRAAVISANGSNYASFQRCVLPKGGAASELADGYCSMSVDLPFPGFSVDILTLKLRNGRFCLGHSYAYLDWLL